jgi:Kef-type K+ transport system membrane component KefB
MTPGLPLPLTHPALIFLLLFLIVLVAPIAAERLRVPGLVGLIVAGVLVGPDGLGLLERVGAVELIGAVGLLYLMFLAGVEMDLEGFEAHRRDSVVFGTATFVIPMVVNTGVALAFGLHTLAAVLIASAFTSHTLLAYPTVQRFGLVRNRAVTATLGATLLSTLAALLVLAIAAAAHVGDIGLLFWVRMVVSLTAFLALSLWALPRVTRWFFASLGQDRAVRFTFVLVALFTVSALAHFAGIQAIVGAFLAGLALNRYVPPGSLLEERIRFLGTSFLIPLFLISTGMLINPRGLIADPRTLLMGAGFSAAAFGAKWLSAWPTARILRFERSELGLITGLSGAQAAGALAAVLVGAQVGLVGADLVNATILVIIATSLASSAVTDRFAPHVPRPARRAPMLGHTVVVPIANPRSAGPLVRLAARIAAADSGTVIPVNILGFNASAEEVDDQRSITAEAEQVALREGAEARALVRIDASPSAGTLHTVVEHHATCVLLGWKGWANRREHFFGGVIDTILANVRVPVLVCRPGMDRHMRRVVLSVTVGDLAPAGRPGFELALDVASRLARGGDAPLCVVAEADDPSLHGLLGAKRIDVIVDARKPPIALRQRTLEGDVIVVGAPPTGAGLGQNAARLAQGLRERTVIATVVRGG